jgi:hypothetical protein
MMADGWLNSIGEWWMIMGSERFIRVDPTTSRTEKDSTAFSSHARCVPYSSEQFQRRSNYQDQVYLGGPYLNGVASETDGPPRQKILLDLLANE